MKFNEEKTEAMFVPAKGEIRRPVIKMKGKVIEMGIRIKYLGLILDSKLLYIENIKKTRQKVMKITSAMWGVMGKKWGLKREIVKKWYEGVIKRMILYGAEIWGRKANDSRVKKLLQAAQRTMIAAIAQCYRTTSNSAWQVMVGEPPLYVEAEVMYEWRVREREGIGNRDEKKEWMKERITQKWQKEWDEEKTGRNMYQIFKKVGMEGLDLGWKGRQLVTGHGKFEGYLMRVTREERDGQCECGKGIETAKHVLENCERMEVMRGREILTERLERIGVGWPLEIGKEQERRVIIEVVAALNEFAEVAVREDDIV